MIEQIVIQIIIGLPFGAFAYWLGYRDGKWKAKKDIQKALHIPDGCEVSGVSYRKVQR